MITPKAKLPELGIRGRSPSGKTRQESFRQSQAKRREKIGGVVVSCRVGNSTHDELKLAANQNEMTITDFSARALEDSIRTSKSAITTVSFFCGAGGMDRGFIGGFEYKGRRYEPLPFNILAAYDNNDKAIETYKQNISPHAVSADLSTLRPEHLPKAELLLGGFPCQDFSSCGPRKGLGSERGRLYRALVDYMDHHKPKMVIGENVSHILRMDKGAILERIKSDIREVGYRVELWNLNAADYGVPQARKRVIIVCLREDIDGDVPPLLPTNTVGTYHTAKWALEDLKGISDEGVPNQSQYFKANRAKKSNGQGDETCDPNKPAYTIRANARSRVQFHYSLPRRLTVRECARLQTFPDDFVFPHSATSNIMQIGNAVPPVLAHQIAKRVQEYLRPSKA